MPISCVYCGGAHSTPAEVKACWSDNPDVAAPGVSAGTVDTLEAHSVPVTAPTHIVPLRRGPDELGRNVLVAPGAEVPAAWAGASIVTLDDAAVADPGPLLETLRVAANSSSGLVIEVAVDLDALQPEVERRAPYELGPRHQLVTDELVHLVTGNAIDARRPETPMWPLVDRAVALGALVGGAADIVLPDGTEVWLDGGPVRVAAPIDGRAVLHAIMVEHGALAPPRGNTTAAELAPDQVAAVTHPGGAARIIAPAGSGKTRVLTERARHLLRQWQLPASAVCLVAFNKRAQQEMVARTRDLPDLEVRTLNSIGLAIINGTPPFAPQRRTWRTIDEPDVRRVLDRLVSFPKRRNTDPVAPWIEALSLVRLGLVDPAEVEERYDGDVDGLAEVWPHFRQALDRDGVVDFDDQIFRAVEVLLTQPVARRAAQHACRVLLVDEFQDLTPAHLLLVRLLAAPGGAVFGVGDDDQTIYGYNGADPAWLIEFGSIFPGAGDHPLEVNYRCPSGVVEVSDRLLRHNQRRVVKRIRAASDRAGGWAAGVHESPVDGSVASVTAALDAGAAPSDIAVLARVNASLAPVQIALTMRAIPVTGGVGTEFAERAAIRAVLAWLRLAAGAGRDSFAPGDLAEALRRPSRPLHPRIAGWVAEQRTTDGLRRLARRITTQRESERVESFAADIDRLRQLVRDGGTTSAVLAVLVDDMGLAGSVASLDATRRGMNRAAQGDDLAAARELARLQPDPARFERWLREQLAAPRDPNGVVLATIHRVKGQEWPHVVVHLADDDQFPHRLADDVEEERRLFHVALTRASEHVTIVSGVHASPFVAELTEEPTAQRPASTRPERPGAATKRPAKPRPEKPRIEELDLRAALVYEHLRKFRERARNGKPAYIVFDDATLASIARALPASLEELAAVRGVGPAKLEMYGDAVLGIVADTA